MNLYKLTTRLWHLFKPSKKIALFLLLAMMFTTSILETISIGSSLPFISFLANPESASKNIYYQQINQVFNPNNSISSILLFSTLFILATLIAGAFRICVLLLTTKISFSIGADISYLMFKRTLYKPYHTHTEQNSSHVISGITQKVNSVIYGIILPILNIINSIILVLVISIPFFIIKPELIFTLVLGFSLIYTFIYYLFRKKLSTNSQELATRTIHVIEIIQYSLGGIRDIIINRSQNFFCNLFKKYDTELRAAEASNILIGQTPRYIVETLGIIFICLLGIMIFDSSSNFNSISALSILGALAFATQKILPIMQSGYSNFTSLKSSITSLKMALEILESYKCDALENAPSINFKNFQQIKFDNVSFRYSNQLKFLFKNINIIIESGSIVGITGKSGSGKSTFLDLILGLLQPTAGSIKIDNHKLNSITSKDWQRVIGHVSQNVFISNTTLVENIGFAIPISQINIERATNSAMLSELSDLISESSEGIFRPVGEHGGFLSGGQRQRIGIARALYKKDAQLLIFDESTSALDDMTAGKIRENLKKLSEEGFTIIIVSHNLSMLKICSKTINIDTLRHHEDENI